MYIYIAIATPAPKLDSRQEAQEGRPPEIHLLAALGADTSHLLLSLHAVGTI